MVGYNYNVSVCSKEEEKRERGIGFSTVVYIGCCSQKSWGYKQWSDLIQMVVVSGLVLILLRVIQVERYFFQPGKSPCFCYEFDEGFHQLLLGE